MHIAAQLGIAPPRLSEKLTGRVYLYPDELIRILRIIGMDDETLKEQRLVDWYQEAHENNNRNIRENAKR